jgi:glycosyltransferase involved in cell wall biosynthesis
MKLLLELRPALDGHAGIPQETRLLFRGLSQLDGVQVEGLLQSSNRLLSRGLPVEEAARQAWSVDRRINRLARVVVSLQPGEEAGGGGRALRTIRLALAAVGMAVSSVFGRRQLLTCFDPAGFEDFIWRSLFAKTLSPEDLPTVVSARYRVARLPWSAAHRVALISRRLGLAVYPSLDTEGFALYIAETPYPGRVRAGTQLVVRYHDAIPMLMPHTISDRAYHQASHYESLRRNVQDGAWFACVSDASRRDLLSVFPEAAARAVTIPNMVSPRYFVDDAPLARVPDVILSRGNREVERQASALRPKALESDSLRVQRGRLDYLLMVSTLEPRKNHLSLLAAWEQLRAGAYPNLRLVLVGMLGWDNQLILNKLLPWVARGQVHILDDVPAADLRVLYRHARATVCPSFGEGFGYSGVEAMCCGGVVAASDLPVHREVYGDAAEYFNPYATDTLVAALKRLIDADDAAHRQSLVALGAAVAARYQPRAVLPLWQTFLDSIASRA